MVFLFTLSSPGRVVIDTGVLAYSNHWFLLDGNLVRFVVDYNYTTRKRATHCESMNLHDHVALSCCDSMQTDIHQAGER